MNTDARWIWLEAGNPRQTNLTLAFRKTFELADRDLQSGPILEITAETRYHAWLNGQWLGEGPARGYPEHYYYDLHDLRAAARTGVNELLVLVNYFGTATFHCVHAPPGLLAALGAAGRTIAVSDGSWQARVAAEYEPRAPRISCQQDFEEHLDARLAGAGAWTPVNRVQTQAEDRHQDLRLRDVRPLGLVLKPFRRAVGAEAILPLDRAWSFKTRELLAPWFRDSNIYGLAGLLLSEFELAEPAEIEFFCLGTLSALLVDGNPLELANDQSLLTARAAFPAGRHLLCAAVAVTSHGRDLSLGYRCPGRLNFHSPSDAGREPPWDLVGPLWKPDRQTNCSFAAPGRTRRRPPGSPPFDTGLPGEVGERVLALARLPADEIRRRVETDQYRPVSAEDMSMADAYLSVRADRPLAGTVAPETDPAACLADDAHGTVLDTGPDGSVRLYLDLDDMSIGYFEMELEAAAGTVVDGYFYEYQIERDGARPRIQHTGDCHNVFRYTCREGRNHFISRRRRGMRYALLTFRNAARPARLRLARVREATYPDDRPGGSFACSDPRLDGIYAISRRTLLLCMEDVFTDCPLYEQTLWIGDARNEALFAYSALGAHDIARRCCRLGAQSLETQPLVGSQVPSGWDKPLPAWSFLWGLMVWEYYFHTGDREFLAEVHPAVMRNLRNAVSFCTDRGLFSVCAWNMFDWARIDDAHNTVLHNSMFLATALDAAARGAQVLGNSEEVGFCREWRARLIAALNALWDETRGAYPDSIHDDGCLSPRICQHTSALALLYDIARPEWRARALANILNPPEGMTRVGSPFAMFYFIEALEKEGRRREALEMVRDYWGVMLAAGAKTCWEVVHLDRRDGFPTRSHCHGWSAAPVYILPRLVLGVRPTAVGWREVEVRPLAFGLEYARGAVPTPFGPITVRWERAAGRRPLLEVEAPPEIKVRSDPSGLE